MRLAVIIPAYNESKVIKRVLTNFQRELRGLSDVEADIILINDGSTDKTAQIAQKTGVRVVNHLLNLGLGGAISTGLKIAHQEQYEAAVTVDSDGQHLPSDLRLMIEEVAKKKADFIVGSRWLKAVNLNDEVPLIRRLGNKYVMNLLTLVFTGFRTTDSQSGLRAFSRRAIEKIELLPQRMEVSTELFSQVSKHKLRYQEIPIRAIYTDYSISKGQRTLNGISIVWRLMMARLL